MNKWMYKIRLLSETAEDVLYPPRCPLCQAILPPAGRLACQCAWTQKICPDCAPKLPWIREPVCKKCGRPLREDTDEYCPECASRQLPYREGRCTFAYSGALRESVLRMKFHGRREYLDFFAAAMADAQRPFLERIRPDVIIPVPMSARKRRQRGFDQCRLLCRKLEQRTGIPANMKALVRIRNTRAQSGLDLSGRRTNVRDAFRVQSSAFAYGQVPGRVLLVDDIFTTGATAEECSRVLLEAGADQVFLLMLCTRLLA